MTDNFHDIRFPSNLSMGSHGGPRRKTEIVTLVNGFEERNSAWSQSLRRFDAGLAIRSLDDVSDVIAFFEARMGPLYGFRWKDWTDYKSSKPSKDVAFDDQTIGRGDDKTRVFQLCKTYVSGAHEHCRAIVKPCSSTVQLGISGDLIKHGDHYQLDETNGKITLKEPLPEDSVLTAGFEFDVPVRFEEDSLGISVSGFKAGDMPSIPIVEIRV